MFKKISMSAAALAVMVLAASPASAATVTPTGAVTLTINSVVTQSQTLNCSNTFSGTVNSNGTITVAANGKKLGTSGLCASVTLNSDWVVTTGTYGSGSAPISVTGITATTLFGTCTQGSASVTGTWTNSPNGGTAAGTIPGTVFGFSAPCTISAAITSSPALTVS
ncbi:MAG: hypothetical protein KA105_06585 [Caulobacter sp.]|jgi:hypothetical protein|nr:hypothetical protein [Caulobacter sp.]